MEKKEKSNLKRNLLDKCNFLFNLFLLNKKNLISALIMAVALLFTVILVAIVPNTVIGIIKHVGDEITEEIEWNETKKLLKVHYLDVEHGDCILIQLLDYNMLIDTGKKKDSEFVIQYLKNQKVDKINSFLITHGHSDHMGGASEIIDQFDVDEIYITDNFVSNNFDNELIDIILEKRKKVTQVRAGQTINTGNKLNINVVSPTKDYEKINDTSIVIHMAYQNTSFLFTGDISADVEQDILDGNYNINADVIKIPHHGISGSSSKSFLEAADSSIAVISCANMPTEKVLRRIYDIANSIVTTVENGTIVICSDGENITCKLEKQ